MSYEDYKKALKLGQREYQAYLSKGNYPYLKVLDEILPNTSVEGEVNLGLVQIPADLIVGTKSAGRRTAFAPNFMPLLSSTSEFASKWSSLCDAHLTEGIRDPIKAYEFMNQFYVVEGNKRVSVLKYFKAASIPGVVTRIIPKRSNDKANKIYFEFLDFYRHTEINYIYFSQEGRYKKLLSILDKDPAEDWTEEEKMDFRSLFSRFQTAYNAKGGKKLPITIGDAFLAYLNVYGYEASKNKLPGQLKEDISKIWDEILLQKQELPVDLVLTPKDSSKKAPILTRILTPSSKVKVAFVHDKSTETSSWTYGHELGRIYVDEKLSDQIETSCVENVDLNNADMVLNEMALDNNKIIFTTTPQLLKPTLKFAVEHPDIKMLNCSLNTSHRYIRTYYARMYEAKFLIGAIAGALSENSKIAYIADYPIYGTIANINAFALGVKMINPRAKIYLEWSKVKEPKEDYIHSAEISCISTQDMIIPKIPSRNFGLYQIHGDQVTNLAMPIWHWGKFYEKLIQNILNGTWKVENSDKAINYWWGLSAGVIDVIYSQNLPIGTRRLIDLLRHTITIGEFNPFSGILYGQNGIIHNEADHDIPPEQIASMDWLLENVIGEIPKFNELTEEAQALVRIQGVAPNDNFKII